MSVREIECPVCKLKAVTQRFRLVMLVSAIPPATTNWKKQEVLYARICPDPKCHVVFYDPEYDK
jgi:hypothetical protein